jgi:hypothetical protein
MATRGLQHQLEVVVVPTVVCISHKFQVFKSCLLDVADVFNTCGHGPPALLPQRSAPPQLYGGRKCACLHVSCNAAVSCQLHAALLHHGRRWQRV